MHSRHSLLALIGFLIWSGFCDAAKIAFVPGRDTGSHQESMRSFFVGLAKRGHDIVVFDSSNKKLKEYNLPNVRVVNLNIPVNETNYAAKIKRLLTEPYRGFDLQNAQRDSNGYMLELLVEHNDKLSDFLNTNFDGIVVDDIPCVHCAVLASYLHKIHGTKIVVFSTTKPLDYHWWIQGMARHPLVTPYMFTKAPKSRDDHHDITSFKRRLDTLFEYVNEKWMFISADYKVMLTAFHSFGVSEFCWFDFYAKTGVFVGEVLNSVGWPMPVLPTTHHTGLECEYEGRTNDLSADLRAFLEDPNSKGTIYIAFGSYIDFNFATDKMLLAFSNGLQRLHDYRIVMVMKSEVPALMPRQSFIKYLKWAPQTAILNHQNTKAFISHGGLKSVKESLCARVPLVLIPIFAEQGYNARLAMKTGIGMVLNKLNLDEYDLEAAVRKVAESPRCKSTVENVYSLITDRVISPLNESIFMTEKFLRADEKAFLRFTKLKSANYSFVRVLYLDMLIPLLAIIYFIK